MFERFTKEARAVVEAAASEERVERIAERGRVEARLQARGGKLVVA